MSLLKIADKKVSTEILKTHDKKLYNLWKSDRARTPNSLLNLSDRRLTLEEENILRFGLNHHILPKNIDLDEMKASVERSVSRIFDDATINHELRDDVKFAVKSFVRNANNVCSSNQNSMYHKTLSDLAKDESIKLCSYDKGNGLVILNSTDYYQKLDVIVKDETKFTEVPVKKGKTHPIISKQNSIREVINENLKDIIDEDVLSKILPTGSQPGKLYGLCKVHKANYPLRPVISMVNTSEYELGKYLDTFIQPNIPSSYITNSTDQFLDNLKHYDFSPNDQTVSFDVVSLYTNIPLLETIKIISDTIYSDISCKVPPFPKLIFEKLLTIATQGMFMYNGILYKQTDGVAMGSPLGPSLANFFLGHLEKTKIMISDLTPAFYSRYIDDIFAVFKNKDHVQPFLNFINDIHVNIKFTVEYANDIFPFLNLEVHFKGDSFDTTVYRKPTHTGQMLNFNAVCPIAWKKGVILCHLNIAKRLCSNDELFNLEVDKLRQMFYDNGYPSFFFQNVLNKFLSPTNPKDDDCDDFTVFKIPFIGEHSYAFGKKIKKMFEPISRIKVRIVYTSFKVRNYFSLKCKTPKQLLSNVVYKFTCRQDADVSYIGETKRHLITRVKEHLALNNFTNKSQIKSHLRSNCNECKLNSSIDSFKVLKRCRSHFDVVIHEALIIRRNNPQLNKQLFNNGSLYTLRIF